MSYILDALNKSDKEKRRHQAPDLGAMHRDATPARRPVPWWVIGLVIFMLLVVAAGAYWLGTSTTGVPAAADNSTAVTAPTNPITRSAEPAVVRQAPVGESAGIIPDSIPDPIPDTIPETQLSPPPRVSVPRDSNETSSGSMPDTADMGGGELITPQDFFARQNREPAVAKSDDVVRISELPPDIQRRIPDLTFSSHIYSDEPSFRLVNINGRSLREGDMIDDGIMLAEISEEGVVLSYLHYTFEVSVLRDWSFN